MAPNNNYNFISQWLIKEILAIFILLDIGLIYDILLATGNLFFMPWHGFSPLTLLFVCTSLWAGPISFIAMLNSYTKKYSLKRAIFVEIICFLIGIAVSGGFLLLVDSEFYGAFAIILFVLLPFFLFWTILHGIFFKTKRQKIIEVSKTFSIRNLIKIGFYYFFCALIITLILAIFTRIYTEEKFAKKNNIKSNAYQSWHEIIQ